MPDIRVLGLADSQPTRAALRFFRERRIVATFVDLRKQPITPGELRRFADRLGVASLVDVRSRAYLDSGPAGVALEMAAIVERVRSDVRVLRLPLVCYRDEVTAGTDEATWTAWLARPRAARDSRRSPGDETA